jgi:hypothetical protein
MFTKKIIGGLSAAATLSMASFLAQAQTPTELAGYKVKFSPRIDFSTINTDNALKSKSKVNDTIADLLFSGNLNLSKEDQTIDSDFGFKATQHLELEAEEIDDFYGGVSLLQNFSDSFLVKAGVRYDDSTITRDSIIEGDADGRTDITTLTHSIESRYTTGKQQYTFSLKRDDLDTLDTEKLDIIVNRDDEDRIETDLTLKWNYMLSDVFQPSITLISSEIDYEKETDDFGLERTSNVIEFLVGGNLKLGNRVNVNGEVGHYSRDYEGVSFENIEATIGNASIGVQVNDKLTAYGNYSRSFAEMNIDATPGLFIDVYTTGLNYSASQKLSFSGSVRQVNTEMELLGIKIRDYVTTVGTAYNFNARYSARLSYSYSRRNSNLPALIQNFNENAFTLKLSAAL